jgi:hypothetical protein
MAKSDTTTVAIPNRFSDEELTAITSIADVNVLFNKYGVSAETIANYGTGFSVVDKATLINKRLMILEWHFYDSDKGGGDMVTVHAFTGDGDKVIFNDGSTGIREQLRRVMNMRMANGMDEATACRALIVNNGLKSRTYQRKDDNGVFMYDDKGSLITATTFNLVE